MKRVTPESVIKLPLPDVEIDDTTGEPHNGPWPTVLLQELIDEAFTPVINKDASSSIRRNVVLWQHYIPSAGLAIFLINRNHDGLYYNRTSVVIPLTVSINNTKYLLKCAAIHHGGLHGGHYTAIIHKTFDSIVYVNDDTVYEEAEILTVLSSKFVRSQVTSVVYETQVQVKPSPLYLEAEKYMREGM